MINNEPSTETAYPGFIAFLRTRDLTFDQYKLLPESDQNAFVASWLRLRNVNEETVADRMIKQAKANRRLPSVTLAAEDRKRLYRLLEGLQATEGEDEELGGPIVTDPKTIEAIKRSRARLEWEERASRRFIYCILLPAFVAAVVYQAGRYWKWWD